MWALWGFFHSLPILSFFHLCFATLLSVCHSYGPTFPPALHSSLSSLIKEGDLGSQLERRHSVLQGLGSGPRSLLGYALVALSRCTSVFLYMLVPALQLGSCFSTCSVGVPLPSKPTSCGIQLSQNTCKIPVLRILQVSVILGKVHC